MLAVLSPLCVFDAAALAAEEDPVPSVLREVVTVMSPISGTLVVSNALVESVAASLAALPVCVSPAADAVVTDDVCVSFG